MEESSEKFIQLFHSVFLYLILYECVALHFTYFDIVLSNQYPHSPTKNINMFGNVMLHYNRSAGQMFSSSQSCCKETSLNILNGRHFISSISKGLVVRACWKCIPSILQSLETRDPTFLLLLRNAILHNPSFSA